jgi:glycosyltransferase involved in cell wall biosynthesis
MNTIHVIFVTATVSQSVENSMAHAEAFISYFSSVDDVTLSVATLTADQTATAEHHEHTPAVSVYTLPLRGAVDASELARIIERSSAPTVLFFDGITDWVEVLRPLRHQFPDLAIVLRSTGNEILQARIAVAGELSERQRAIADTINATADTVIANSKYTREQLERTGIANSLIQVMCGGVPAALTFEQLDLEQRSHLRAWFGIPEHSFLFVSACHMSAFRGLPDTIRAFTRLQQHLDSPAYLLVLGDGPERQALETFVREQRISHYVRFSGPLEHDVLRQVLLAADAYCHTPIPLATHEPGGMCTITETMGRPFCEAAAAGMPVIATTAGGVPEVVEHEVTGLLADPYDIDGISEHMHAVVSNAALRQFLSISARERARREFTWEYSIFPQYQAYIIV